MFLQSSSILAKKVLYWLAEQTLAALPLRLSVIRNMLEENLHSTIVLLLDSSLQSLMQPRLRKLTPKNAGPVHETSSLQDCVAKLLRAQQCIIRAADKVKKREIDFDTLEQYLRAQWVEIANITVVIIAETAK